MGYLVTDNKDVVCFILKEGDDNNIEFIAEDLKVYRFNKTYVLHKKTQRLLKIDKKKIYKCKPIKKEELLCLKN